MALDPLHARILEIAAGLPEARTVALAGGGAMLAHDIVDRATKDVDLFTDRDGDEAVRIASALRVELVEYGFTIEPAPRPPHENRFRAVETTSGQQVLVEVFPDGGRLHAPVQLDIGPVLHPEDLAADKTLAMWGRGEPRDYLDVAALLAASKDRGLTEDTFVVSLRAIRRLTPDDWRDAMIAPERGADVRAVILAWAERLS